MLYGSNMTQTMLTIPPLFFALILTWWLYQVCRLRQENGDEPGFEDQNMIPNIEDDTRGGDDIIPVHFIDQAAIVRTSIINYTFRYADVLDPSKLHRGLLDLVQMPGWRKLGGRMRVNKNGKLEIHVPKHFSTSRPAVQFSHIDHTDIKIESHLLASRLPKPTGSSPSIQDGCHKFRLFAVPTAFSNDIKSYWKNDKPLLCLHVTTFADATLVGITFPHSLSDALGTSDLLKAWSVMVSSPCFSVKPILGARDDVLDSVGTALDEKGLKEEFVLESQQSRGFSLVSFLARFLWNSMTDRSISASHIYLPAEYMAYLRNGVEEELRKKNDGRVPFVSDGDIITAWGSRMVMSSKSWRGCSAVICNVFDLRSRLKNTFASGGTYLQNLILPATTVLPKDEAATATTSQIALLLRQAIQEQTSDVQIRRLMYLTRQWFASMGTMPLFVRWDSQIIACTNWTKAKFLDAADVGPTALINADKSKLANSIAKGDPALVVQPGKPVMYWGTTLSVTDNPRDVFVIYGKDASNNCWLHAYLRKDTWDLIHEDFQKFSCKS